MPSILVKALEEIREITRAAGPGTMTVCLSRLLPFKFLVSRCPLQLLCTKQLPSYHHFPITGTPLVSLAPREGGEVS